MSKELLGTKGSQRCYSLTLWLQADYTGDLPTSPVWGLETWRPWGQRRAWKGVGSLARYGWGGPLLQLVAPQGRDTQQQSFRLPL